MVWTIKYTASCLQALKKLDRPSAKRVLDYMDQRIVPLADPRVAGKNLRGPRMGSYWRFRVGDLRIICDIQDNELLVLVLELGHRREIYRSK